MTMADIQRALRAAGFDPGPIDGIAGPRTRAAIRAFQRAAGLVPDGIAGPRTRAALAAAAERAAPAVPAAVPEGIPWLAEAVRHLGQTEAPGAADNPRIMAWARDLGLAYAADSVPWCGLFVAHCLKAALPAAVLPPNPLGARQWLGFGREVAPQVGAVLVFWRGRRDGWTGHVGFGWAEDATHFHVLGGNQADAVTITRIARDRLLGARWPLGLSAPGIVRRSGGGGIAVSVNEA
jgi:uncharacterized protein (TIGR02594 family)